MEEVSQQELEPNNNNKTNDAVAQPELKAAAAAAAAEESTTMEQTTNNKVPNNKRQLRSLPVLPPDDPTVCYSMEEFPNHSLFNCTQIYPSLSVPIHQLAKVRKLVQKHLLKKLKNVHPDSVDQNRKTVVLQLGTTKNDIAHVLSDDTGVTWRGEASYCITTHYDDLNAEQILTKLLVLPTSDKEEIPCSYEMVGTIAHVNLKEIWLPFKYWIGHVLLQCNKPNTKTVINKVGTIETEFRTFDMEILAGSDKKNWSVTTVHEHGFRYTLDYKTVYWNSRLSGEHQRMVQSILQQGSATKGEERTIIVADAMAGVGPFAIPLTSNRNKSNNNVNIICYANDLNPESYKYLQINAKQNKCSKDNLIMTNLDGREFLSMYLPQQIMQQQTKTIDDIHVILNLPASAPEFLNAFSGYNTNMYPKIKIHVYCFADKKIGYESDVLTRCQKSLGCDITDEYNIRIVRNVSPHKNMVCFSFILPRGVSEMSPWQEPAAATDVGVVATAENATNHHDPTASDNNSNNKDHPTTTTLTTTKETVSTDNSTPSTTAAAAAPPESPNKKPRTEQLSSLFDE